MKLACVAIVKNEQRHIAEWLAYQFAIGFDTVILLDNQSTDATVTCARAFSPTYDVRVLDWNLTTRDYQPRAYEHAVHTFLDEFAWMAFFDTDEYLVIDPPFDLRAILTLWTDIPAIGIPWAMFGSSGYVTRPEGLLIENFLNRSEPAFGPNRHIKSIIRPSRMQRCENAHMFVMDGDYRSLSGLPLSFSQDGLLTKQPDYAIGKLHHYFTRSRDHWADKMRRGYHDTTRENSEFEIYDRNEIPDASATRLAPQTRAILDAVPPHSTTPYAVIASEVRQSSPETPTTSQSNQEGKTAFTSYNVEPSPSQAQPQHSGTWALLTEFGTLLCWNPTDNIISHCSPGQCADQTLILWRNNATNDLVISHNDSLEIIDPISGEIGTDISPPPIDIVPGERKGDIAFKLMNGAFLSARPAPSPRDRGPVDINVRSLKSWECFTPIDRGAAQTMIDAERRRIAYFSTQFVHNEILN